MFPVEDPQHRRRVAHALDAMFRDTVKSRRLRADGTYDRRAPSADEPPFRAQQELQEEARRASAARQAEPVSLQPEQRRRTRSR
jgi:polyphosphate kinase